MILNWKQLFFRATDFDQWIEQWSSKSVELLPAVLHSQASRVLCLIVIYEFES